MTHPVPRTRKSKEEVIKNAARVAASTAARELLDTLSLIKTTDPAAEMRKTLLRFAAEEAADLSDFIALLGSGDAAFFLKTAVEDDDPDYARVLDQALDLVGERTTGAAA